MRSKFKVFISVFTIIILGTISTAYAHSGRTDSSGGHRDNKNASGLGSYHYHHGYSAHLHPNGICPYTSSETPTVEPLQTETETEMIPEVTPHEIMESSIAQSSTSAEISVYINGNKVDFDQLPVLINDRVMVPIRYVVEEIGCTVNWDDETQSVYINERHTPHAHISRKSDHINVYVNQEIILFDDQQPVNINGRILLPLRPVVEKLGYLVDWNPSTLIVNITSQ